jgi:hypothetical protein
MTTRDVGDRNVKARTVAQGGIHERARSIEPPPARTKHALDQVPDLFLFQSDRRQNVPAGTRTEDPARPVDPDLLDIGVVEQLLQSSEAGDPVQHRLSHRGAITDPRQGTGLHA